MENNFYVGIICHFKKISKYSWHEKVILYSEDNLKYIDLINFRSYCTEENIARREDYVVKDSLLPVDITDYNIDYIYLLNKYKQNGITKKYTKKNN